MKPAIMSAGYLAEPGTTVRSMFAFARANGIAGIDFFNLRTLNVSLDDIRSMCGDYQVKAICHTFFNSIHTPGMSLAQWLDATKQAVEDAVFLETGRVMLPTFGQPGIDRHESRKRWLEALSLAVAFGKTCQTAICIESFLMDAAWSPFVTSDELLDAVIRVPGLKIAFDTGNHFVSEDVIGAYRKLASAIDLVHLKDWEIFAEPAPHTVPMPDGRHYRMVPIGCGVVDNAACLRLMRQNGDRHYFDLEYAGALPAPDGIRLSVQYTAE